MSTSHRSNADLANEVRRLVKSLNDKIAEAHRQDIIVVVNQENSYYSRLPGKPCTVTVEIREEHIL